MKKRRIVIASILKPVDDTRMFEKMASTLADTGADVSIIGFHAEAPQRPAITALTIGPFQRISLSRWFAPLRVLSRIARIKPDLLIVNSHELLFAACACRFFLGAKIVYDIRENYYRNLLYGKTFPSPLAEMLALWVRLKEKITAPFFHHFLLAEAAYADEMNFFSERFTVVENKSVIGFLGRTPAQGKTRLLFTGTLAESTGVFLAIELAQRLHAADSSIQLTIIGYAAQHAVLNRIRTAIADAPYITLAGGTALVPHADIVGAISSADFGIVAYPISRHTENAIPTKLYEYLSCELPILLQNHEPWVRRCEPYKACVLFDPKSIDAAALLAAMKGPFYTSRPTDVSWKTEGEKLVTCLNNIFA